MPAGPGRGLKYSRDFIRKSWPSSPGPFPINAPFCRPTPLHPLQNIILLSSRSLCPVQCFTQLRWLDAKDQDSGVLEHSVIAKITVLVEWCRPSYWGCLSRLIKKHFTALLQQVAGTVNNR